ncbi:MAG TPA: LysE family translocator [Inquilinus sp.]|nr:LysE family translocator [Inquilinus sp.]
MDQQLLDPGTWRPVLSLVLAALVVMGSPGPSTISVTAVGAAFGFRRSLPYVSGLILGTTAVLLAIAAGLVSILLSLPRLAPVLLGLSVAYMIYLAFRIATAPPLSEPGKDVQAPGLVGGFLLAVANPKAYLAIAAVFTGTTLAVDSRLTETVIKTAVLTGMIVLIHVAWLVAGSAFARLLRQPTASRIANLLFAAILLATTAMAIVR